MHGALPATTAARKLSPPPKPAMIAESSATAIASSTLGSEHGSAAVVAPTSTAGTSCTTSGSGIAISAGADAAMGAPAIDSRTPIAVTARPMGKAGPRIGERCAAC